VAVLGRAAHPSAYLRRLLSRSALGRQIARGTRIAGGRAMTMLSDPKLGPQILGGPSEQRGVNPHVRDDYRAVVKWIPIVVPLFAVLLASVAYLVGWGVLD
jgi:hypothetical protein